MINRYEANYLPNVYNDLANSLVLLYDFRDGGTSSIVTDVSNNAHTGSIVSSDYENFWTSGGSNGAYFSGTDSVSVANNSVILDLPEGTIEYWVKHDENITNTDTVLSISKDSDYSNYHFLTKIYADGTFTVRVMNGSGNLLLNCSILNTTYELRNVIAHIIFTVDSTGHKIYIDGTNYTDSLFYNNGSTSSNYFLNSITGADQIQVGSLDSIDYLQGSLYKLAIYDTVLSVKQIQTIYNYERLFFTERPDNTKLEGMTEGIIFQNPIT